MKSFRQFIEAFDADAEAEKLKAEREAEQDKARAKREKEKQDRADKALELKQADDERKFITPADLEDAEDEAEKTGKSFIDILKRMKR